MWCAAAEAKISTSGFNLADADFAVLHSPFVKMVRKGFARLVYQDHLRALARRTAAIQDVSPLRFSIVMFSILPSHTGPLEDRCTLHGDCT